MFHIKHNSYMKAMMSLLLIAVAITASAQSLEGTSNSVNVELTKPAAENDMTITLASLGITQVPKYHALIMGVSNYQNTGPGLPNLDMPSKDAERLYSILIDKYEFDPKYVTLLKNPTREEIINKFDHLAETVKEKDNVLIFYAGHGFYDKEKDFGFWLPADSKLTSKSAWIANSTIKDYIGAIKSKHTLLITDACFGGSIFKSRSVDAVIRRFHDLYKDNSRKALTSGNLTEVPDKSVFLKFLIKNLDDNNDLFLPSSTLFTRMYEPIMDNTTTTPQFGVIQGAGDEGGDFIFIRKK
jgi:hypothetical protein